MLRKAVPAITLGAPLVVLVQFLSFTNSLIAVAVAGAIGLPWCSYLDRQGNKR